MSSNTDRDSYGPKARLECKPDFSEFEIEITESQNTKSQPITKACGPDDAIKIILWASTIVPVGNLVKYFFTAEQVNKIKMTAASVATGINALYVFENKFCLDILNHIISNTNLLKLFNFPESCLQELPQEGFVRSTTGVKWLIKSVLQAAETSNAEVVKIRDWATEMLECLHSDDSGKFQGSMLNFDLHSEKENLSKDNHVLFPVVRDYLSCIQHVYTWYPCFLHGNFSGISQDEFITQILNYNKNLKMLLGCKRMNTSILENPVFKLIKIPQDTVDLLSDSDDSELCAVSLEDIIQEYEQEQEYLEQCAMWKNPETVNTDQILESIINFITTLEHNIMDSKDPMMIYGFKNMILLQSLKIGLKERQQSCAKNKSVVDHAKAVFPVIQKYFYKDLAETIIYYGL